MTLDLEATAQVCQVGAHFKALGKGVLMAPLDLRCIFLRPKRTLRNVVGKVRTRYTILDDTAQLINKEPRK